MNIHPSWLRPAAEKPLLVCQECQTVFTAANVQRLTCSDLCRKQRRKRLARVRRYCVWQMNPSTPVDMVDVKARMPRWLQEVT